MKVGTNGGAAKIPQPKQKTPQRDSQPARSSSRSSGRRQVTVHHAVSALKQRLADTDGGGAPGTRSFKALKTTPSDTLRETLRLYGPNDAPANHTPQPESGHFNPSHFHLFPPPIRIFGNVVGPHRDYLLNPLPYKRLTQEERQFLSRGRGQRYERGTVNPIKDTTKNDSIADSNFEFLTPQERRRIVSRT